MNDPAVKKYRIKPGHRHYIPPARKGEMVRVKTAGQIIELTEERAKPILDKLVAVKDDPVQVEEKKAEAAAKPEIKQRADGLYEIINTETGQPINTRPLTEDEVKKMAETGQEPPLEL